MVESSLALDIISSLLGFCSNAKLLHHSATLSVPEGVIILLAATAVILVL